MLDGDIYPEQYEPKRITRADVQEMLQKVTVSTGFPLHEPLKVAGVLDPYTRAYPDRVKAKVEITLKNGESFICEKEDYHGFFTQPFSWEAVEAKFRRLTAGVISDPVQQRLITLVKELDSQFDLSELAGILSLTDSSGGQ